MTSKTTSALQAPVYAASALALSSFGDAFLYPFLPLHGERLGMTVAWVGILLSINRFARIFTNALIARACAHYGFRLVTVVAVVTAILSTLGYGVASGLVSWIVCRIAWGLSYSALRISAISYSLDHPRQGFSLGLSKSIQEAGPMITLMVAPFLFQWEMGAIFIVLSIASLPALYFAIMLPKKFSVNTPFSFKRFAKIPSAINLLTFTSAVLIEGMLVVTIGVLFLRSSPQISIMEASILAAAYLAYRRVCLISFSPFGGWIADRFGLERVFVISFTFFLAGLVLLNFGWIEFGAVVVFAFYSILSALTPGAASIMAVHQLDAVSENATWRDVGAAVGTLAGGLLLESDLIMLFLMAGTATLAVLFIYYANSTNMSFKSWMIWK